mgnify:CR=1 FL=1
MAGDTNYHLKEKLFMPTPLGHSIAGLAIWIASIDRLEPRSKIVRHIPYMNSNNVFWAILCIFFANVPDIDFIHLAPSGGLTVSGVYHHGIVHSIGFTLVLAMIVSICTSFIDVKLAKPVFSITLVCASTHLLLDTLLFDSYEINGVGLPMLWPLTEKYFYFPIMTPFDRANLLAQTNLIALIQEFLLTGGMCVAAYMFRRKRLSRLKKLK